MDIDTDEDSQSMYADPSKSSDESRPGVSRQCAVCGDSPAKVHYGVLACFGCKGFFRRAVKDGQNKYVCRYDRKCKVDKYERNSCRYCRFQRCLKVGMNPDSVRPDRDQTGKQRIARLTKIQKKIISPNLVTDAQVRKTIKEELAGDDWTRYLNLDLRKILVDLINLDVEIQKTAGSVNQEAISNFSLRRLINERVIKSTKAPCPTTSQHVSIAVSDLSVTSLWRLVQIVDWIEGLCRIAETDCEPKLLTVDDKLALLQQCFAPYMIFMLAAKNATSSTNSDIFCLYGCNDKTDKTGKNDLVTRTLTEFVTPLRRLAPSDAELVVLKAIITVNPDARGLSKTAVKIVNKTREMLQELLFKSLKKSRPRVTFPSAQFGNYLLLLPILKNLADSMQENLRKQNGKPTTPNGARSYEQILYELFNPDEVSCSIQQDFSELSDRSDHEVDQISRLPNIIHTRASPTVNELQTPATFPSAFSSPSPIHSDSSFTSSDTSTGFLKASPALQAVSSMNLIPQATLPIPSPQYGQYLTATYANTLSTSQSSLFARPTTLPFIRTVDARSTITRNTETTKSMLPTVAKLPLQFTKSMEEMLKPPGQTEEVWNRPLGNDWANGMSTPNKEIVAHFFPECADAI